jgi:hypothetical protein
MYASKDPGDLIIDTFASVCPAKVANRFDFYVKSYELIQAVRTSSNLLSNIPLTISEARGKINLVFESHNAK